MPSLPYDGETAWGDILNTYLTALQGEADSTQTSLQNHAANSPADPHGDRAYAQSLVAPFTTGLNQANGLVKLNGSGTIPASLITASSSIGGQYNAIVDAVTMFGVTPNNGVDQSASLQSALNFVANLGGGIVYVGPGTFSLASPVYIGSNTWLQMSSGTVLQRIPGSPNAPYMLTNVQLTSTSTPASNIKITGGTLNAVGSFSITSSCTLIELFQGGKHIVDGVTFYAPASNSHAIEVNGVSGATISNCLFDGVSANTAPSNSCVLINASNSSTSPSGLNSALYTGQQDYVVSIENCEAALPPAGHTYAAYGCLVGSDVASSNTIQPQGISVTASSFSVPAAVSPVYMNNASWIATIFSANSWGDGPGTSGSYAANGTVPYDTWINCSLSSGFSNSSGNYPLQYKLSQDGTLYLFGAVNAPGSGYTNPITTLPYHPVHQVFSPVAYTFNNTTAVFVNLRANGQVVLQNATSAVAGNPVFINCSFPTDFSGDGLNT